MRLLFFIIVFVFSNLLGAQDVHFSQIYNSPLTLNPALTGLFFGDQRATLNFKDQWRSIGKTYRTYAASYDQGILKKKMKHSYLGIGGYVFADKAGDLNMGKTSAQLNFSGIIELNSNQMLSAGMYASYSQHSIDFTAGQWDSQFNGNIYDALLPSNETELNTNSWANADVGVGLNWYYEQGEATLSSYDAFRINIGVSASHLNRPKLNYLLGNSIVQENLDMKFLIHGISFIGLSNTNTSLNPSFSVSLQGSSTEIVTGLLYRIRIREASKYTGFFKEAAWAFGLHYRWRDAVVPALFFEFDNFALGVSYDTNISGLNASTNLNGGFEISLRFINPNPFHYSRRSNKPSL